MRLGNIAAAPFLGSQFVSLYLGAVRVPTVPGVPAIDAANSTNGTTLVTLFGTPANGGSPITSFEFTFDGVPVVPDIQDLTFPFVPSFTFNSSYVGADVRVRVVNAVGAGPYSAERFVN